MNDHLQESSTQEIPLQAKDEISASLNKIQERLSFLEKKIDMLVNQSSESSFKRKPFSKPFRSHGRPFPGSGDRNNHSPRDFSQRNSFRKPRGEQHRKFGPRNDSFSPRPKDRH